MEQTTPTVTTELISKGSKTVTWELKNWVCYHDAIAASQVGCTVQIPSQVSLRFFLQPYEKDWRDLNQNSYIIKGYSLCAQLLEFSKDVAVIKVAASASVLQPSTNNYPREYNITISADGTVTPSGSKGKSTVVIDEFIHLKSLKRDQNNGSKYYQGQIAVNGVGVLKSATQQDLNVYIHVTVFSVSGNDNCSGDNQNLTGQEEGTEAEVSMMDHLKRMYVAGNNFSDLKLESKDNMTLSAHKFQLAARSPYFRRVIEEAVNGDEFDGILKIEQVNGKPLMMILHWVYTGELEGNAGRFMEELVDAAIKFELTGLLKVLDKKLIAVCNEDNMFRLHQVAKNNAMPTAIENIAAFIRENV